MVVGEGEDIEEEAGDRKEKDVVQPLLHTAMVGSYDKDGRLNTFR